MPQSRRHLLAGSNFFLVFLYTYFKSVATVPTTICNLLEKPNLRFDTILLKNELFEVEINAFFNLFLSWRNRKVKILPRDRRDWVLFTSSCPLWCADAKPYARWIREIINLV